MGNKQKIVFTVIYKLHHNNTVKKYNSDCLYSLAGGCYVNDKTGE